MRLLYIEDEEDIRNYVEKSLEADYFIVDSAPDGKTGLNLAQMNRYDLILLDNVMPEISGLEVCKILREQGNTTPIIMLSVKTEVDTKVELLNSGADDYMTKPFSVTELAARIRALLRRGEKLEKEIISVGDLIIDTAGHTVTKNDQQISLTRKEFMLLECLVKEKGTVISRRHLLEHVWETSMDPFSNTIESHIRSLRKKLETDGQKLIHTISGVGYKIIDE